MLVNLAHQSLLNIHQSNCDAYSTHAALLNIDLQWHKGRAASCRVSWKSCVVFLEVEVKAKTIQPFDLSDAESTELWWVSLRQTRTQKHLYAHNKTTVNLAQYSTQQRSLSDAKPCGLSPHQ